MFLTLTYDDALSPRMRGCFRALEVERFGASAFPAYAGMFPKQVGLSLRPVGFPRVCGDVSDKEPVS